jgi:putative MATE family efflux protein
MTTDAVESAVPPGTPERPLGAPMPPGDGALRTTRPAGGILELAWPAILSNLLYSTVGLVDIKIVGSLGPSAVAAVTTGNRMFFVLQGVLMAVTAGTTALVARAWGAGDRDEAERVTRASVVVCLGVSLVMSIPGLFFADALAGIFRLDALAVSQAASFIRWLSVFNVTFAVSFVLGTACRAAGDTLTPLWIGAVTNVVNVVLVYALIYGAFGIPSFGVAGAAIANGLAFTLGAVIFVVMWLRGTLIVGVGPAGAMARDRLREILRIGYPAGIEQAVWQLGFIAFLWVVALYGTAPYAAYGIGVQILALSFVVGFGFSIAASTHVGQKLGARDPDGAERSGWHAMRLAVASMIVLGAIVIATAEQVASFMIDDPEVVRLTVVFIYILGGCQPLMAVEFTLGGSLRGAGDTRFPLYAVFTGLVGIRVALSALFAWLGLPVEWIFAALIADYVVKVAMLSHRFRGGRWKGIDLGSHADSGSGGAVAAS